MTTLLDLLNTYRNAAVTEREKGTYFEELTLCYLRNEATYRDLYSDVWTYGEWAELQGLDKRDAGIDLVARTAGTGEYHAIQCKLYGKRPANSILDRPRGACLALRRWPRRRAASGAAAAPRSGCSGAWAVVSGRP